MKVKVMTNNKTKISKRRAVLHVRLFEDDETIIKRNAKRHAQGDVSAWSRHAAKFYRPRKGEKIELLMARS